MDLQETIVLIIKEREEAIQLLTMDPQVYKELLTHHRRRTNGHDEPLHDGVQIGSDGSGLCGGWINISSTPQGFWNIGVFIEQRGVAGGHRGGHNPTGRAWASRRALVSCAHLGLPLRYFFGPLDVFQSKKSTKSFTAFGLRLILITCNVKNMQKQQLALGTMSIGQYQKMI